jgi:hypothetical protein
LVADLLTGPHRVLLGAGEYPNRLRQFGISGYRPVRRRVGAQDVGEHHRIHEVGLGAGDLVAGAVSRCGQGVDRIDRPVCRPQRGHQQSAIGFDRHRYRSLGSVAGPGEQFEQPGEPGRVVADPGLGHHLAGLVEEGEVVVGLGPVDPTEQSQIFTIPSPSPLVTSLAEVTRHPNHRTRWSDISLAVRDSSTPQDLIAVEELEGSGNLGEVDPAAGSRNGIPPHTPVCRQARLSFSRRQTPGTHGRRPTADHRNTNHGQTAMQPIPTN